MKRQYIIPMAEKDVCLAEWLSDLKPRFGIDTLFLVSDVLHGIITNDANPYTRVIGYINTAMNHMYESMLNLSGSAVAAKAYEEEVDKYTMVCIDVCDVIKQHMLPYVFAIEKTEADNGADTTKLYWAVVGYVGDDVIIEVSDEEEAGRSGCDHQW